MNQPPSYQDLYDACFVPGSWTCPECGFIWNKSTITLDGIGTTETDRQSDPCPNDGTWMEPTTYQHVARSLHEGLDVWINKCQIMRGALEEIAKHKIDMLSPVLRAIGNQAQEAIDGVKP